MVLPEPTNWLKKYRDEKLKLVKLWYCQCPFDLETESMSPDLMNLPKDASMQVRSETSKW